MDKLNEILNNLRERFSNPLLFSFISAWLIFNWKVPVALIWYDPSQIHNGEACSIFDFIGQVVNSANSFSYPFYSALLYTAFFPIIKNVIMAFYSWTNKWGENWKIKIVRGGSVPIEKYLKFKQEYDQRTKILENMIKTENVNFGQLNGAQTQLMQAKTEILELQNKVNEMNLFTNQLYDVNILNGYWTNTYANSDNKANSQNEEIYLEGGKYYIIQKYGEKVHEFDIVNFCFDSRHKTIFFIKQLVKDKIEDSITGKQKSKISLINTLKYDTLDLIYGNENQTTIIEYKRKILK